MQFNYFLRSNPLNEQINALSEYRNYKSVNYNVFESLPNEGKSYENVFISTPIY